MRYAITGATGFIGGRLTHRLRDDGHDVVALMRSPEKATVLRQSGIELVPGDVTDPRAVRTMLEGVDGLFHVAGWYHVGVRDPSPAYRVNVEGTRTVLQQMREAGVARGVYTSTLAVNSDTHGRVVDETYRFEGRHLTVYDETKAEAHRVAEQMGDDGLPLVTVMPGVVYGPGDTSQTGAMLRGLVAGKRPVVPSSAVFCWAHADDVVDGHVRAMDRGTTGQAYMLAGPVHALADALRLAAGIAGRRGPVVVPGSVVRVAARATRALARAEPLRASTASYLGDPAKAGAELGWSARPLAEGLRQTIDAERAAG